MALKLASVSGSELVNLDQIVRIKTHFGNVDNHTELVLSDGSKIWLPKAPDHYLKKWRYSLTWEGIGG